MKKLLLILFLSSMLLSANAQRDKQLHFAAGAVIAPWGMLTVQDKSDFKQSVTGVAWAIGLGVTKELVDMTGFYGGTAEIKDVGYTIAGAVTGVLIVSGVKAIIRKTKKNKRYKNHDK